MTVKELIETLKQYPEETVVYVNVESDYARSNPVSLIHKYDDGIELL